MMRGNLQISRGTGGLTEAFEALPAESNFGLSAAALGDLDGNGVVEAGVGIATTDDRGELLVLNFDSLCPTPQPTATPTALPTPAPTPPPSPLPTSVPTPVPSST